MTYLPPLAQPIRTIGGRVFDFAHEIVVMGIVNRTPDSFYDQGRTYALDRAVEAGRRATADGAGWIDVGGCRSPRTCRGVARRRSSTGWCRWWRGSRPKAWWSRSTPYDRSWPGPRSRPARGVINDTSGLRDPELADVVAGSAATLVITHSAAAPGQPLRRPTYDDVVTEIRAFLADRVELAVARGVPPERIVIDPGHDLNKNTRHSLEITRRFAELADLGLPVLAAVSNKDFVGESVGLERGERLEASLAAATVCALNGARILRMHQVRAVGPRGPDGRGHPGPARTGLPAPQHDLTAIPLLGFVGSARSLDRADPTIPSRSGSGTGTARVSRCRG